jgi:hypothetical protein
VCVDWVDRVDRVDWVDWVDWVDHYIIMYLIDPAGEFVTFYGECVLTGC